MNYTAIAFLILISSGSLFAKNINIKVEGIDSPVKCSEEPSIQGYFCQSGVDFLIVRSFGDRYSTFGKLGRDIKKRSYTVEKIESNDGQLIYESHLNVEGHGGMISFPNVNLDHQSETSPESLVSRYSDILREELILTQPLFSDESSSARTKAYDDFLKQEMAVIQNEKQEVFVDYQVDTLDVSLEDGSQLRCERGKARPVKSEIDLAIEESKGVSVQCGIFRCGKDERGNERLLFISYDPAHGFANLLYPSSNGFEDGPRVKSIQAKEREGAPLIVYDYSSSHGNSPMGNMGRGPEISQNDYLPENLNNQSNFFHNWSTSGYERMLRDTGRLCEEDSWKTFNTALNAYEKKLSEAQLAHYITIVNNVLTGYYLPVESIPSGACVEGDVFYNPQAYKNTISFLPSMDKRVISKEKAEELFNYAKGMRDIAWDYKLDGCYARAHLMSRRMEAMGVDVDKAWLKGDLSLEEDDENIINWNFHVAPMVYVENEEGKVEKYIIDPSTFDEPVPVGAWSDKLTSDEQGVEVTSFPFPQNASMYNRNSLAFSSSDPYLPDDNLGLTEEKKRQMSIETMERYSGVYQ